MVHRGRERTISYEAAQLLVNLLDLCAGRVAYPIDEPESVEAKTTVDELFGRDGWELPTLHGVDDNRAASRERFGQIAHGSSAHRIEDETEFLPAKSILNIFLEVVALEYYTVASELPHLIGRFFSTHDIQRFDSCQLRDRR